MSATVPLYGFGGGGGSGATLKVTAPSGVTVTVSKDGKTKTKVAGADGVAVFKGLATGKWTRTITDGVQTAEKQIDIIADYEDIATFFAATISVTYPAGSICTCTDGTTTLTAPDTSGKWDCVVPNVGLWIVSLDSGFYERVTVENEETYTINRWHIYNNGVEYTDICGDWKSKLDGPGPSDYFQKLSDHLRLYPYHPTDAVFQKIWHENNIDMSRFSKVCAVVTIPKVDGNQFFGIFESSEVASDKTPWNLSGSVIKTSIPIGTNITVQVDISSYKQTGVVSFACSSGSLPLDIYEIWVE